MRWLAALLLVLAGCSGDKDADGEQSVQSESVLLITRAEGRDDSALQAAEGRLRVRSNCVLLNGQLVVFPYGTRLVDGSAAVRLDVDSEAIPLDGDTEVRVSGSYVPLGKASDWDHAMDEENLDRWSECRQRADISEYADWWQVTGLSTHSE